MTEPVAEDDAAARAARAAALEAYRRDALHATRVAAAVWANTTVAGIRYVIEFRRLRIEARRAGDPYGWEKVAVRTFDGD